MSQYTKILNFLKSKPSLTAETTRLFLHVGNLRARVRELRLQGHKIISTPDTRYKNGQVYHITKYKLEKDGQ